MSKTMVERMREFQAGPDDGVEERLKGLGLITDKDDSAAANYAMEVALAMLDTHIKHEGMSSMEPENLVMLVATTFLSGACVGIEAERSRIADEA